MAATTPVKKSPIKEWMPQAAPLREASTVKKMNDQSLLFCLNKITHYFKKNWRPEVNSMNLMSKIRGRREKMSKTKIVRKGAYMSHSKAKGFCTEPQKGSFRYILIPFHLLMQKDLK